MPKTLEHYKEAIRIKFEKEKSGSFSNYFNPTSQANLRDLCWKIYISNSNPNDLNVYYNFFKFKFDPLTENTSITYTDKFKKIGDFFKRKTEPAKIDTIELAAILIDFEPRPFGKFREKWVGQDEAQYPEDKIPESFDEVKIDVNGGEKEEEKEKTKNEETKKQTKSRLTKLREKILVNFRRKLLITSIVVAILFLLILTSASFFKKDCMIWVNDHYEELERSDEGYCDTYYDARYFDLKKIKVCDTTTFFDNNGKAKVWYMKVSSDSIECFDRCAPYPLNTNKFLKPITKRMIDKYLSTRLKCE